jgi:hypothetical protein
MRSPLLLGILFWGTTAVASKCMSPAGDWWNSTLRPEAEHFQFLFDWEHTDDLPPPAREVIFRDSKSQKSVLVLTKSGVSIDGKKACGSPPFSLVNCPKDLPLKGGDEGVFFGESAGLRNGKVTLNFRGQLLEAVFPDETYCRVIPAEAAQKKLVEETMRKHEIPKFLDSARSCLAAKDEKCRAQFFSKKIITQFRKATAEGLEPLSSLLTYRSYPSVLHGMNEVPNPACPETKPDLSTIRIVGQGCDYLHLTKQKQGWRISFYEPG